MRHGTNPPKGDSRRIGAVRDRSQAYNPVIERWPMRNTENGQFMRQKDNGEPFKGVRREG